ncbi:hypothetical protein M5E87_15810 [Flavonifractor plautii]|nr:hypothetical protein M5E87_15810 [Flavonifractor plautii]
MDPEPFCQAIAVPWPWPRSGGRAYCGCGPLWPCPAPGERPLFAAAERLCPQVRHLVVDVPGEGRNWRRGCGRSMARRCCGPAGRPRRDPGLWSGWGGEGRVLRLYGPAPGLACAPYRRREGCRRTWPPSAAVPVVGVRPPDRGTDPDPCHMMGNN